jgi:hypothetical protein
MPCIRKRLYDLTDPAVDPGRFVNAELRPVITPLLFEPLPLTAGLLLPPPPPPHAAINMATKSANIFVIEFMKVLLKSLRSSGAVINIISDVSERTSKLYRVMSLICEQLHCSDCNHSKKIIVDMSTISSA